MSLRMHTPELPERLRAALSVGQKEDYSVLRGKLQRCNTGKAHSIVEKWADGAQQGILGNDHAIQDIRTVANQIHGLFVHQPPEPPDSVWSNLSDEQRVECEALLQRIIDAKELTEAYHLISELRDTMIVEELNGEGHTEVYFFVTALDRWKQAADASEINS